jgi:hypothetical protein
MTSVTVSTDVDVSFSNPGDPVVVLANDDIETIVVNEQGPPGRPGPPGPQGPMGTEGLPGNTVLYGNIDPTTPVGRDGDFYINTTTHFIFGPKAGVWPAGTSLIGPQGIPGNTVLYGAGAPAAGTGVDGNFYIDTTAHFLYGPKAAGAWPAGTSMIGPQGPQGIQGIQGPPGAVPEAPTDGKIYGRQNSGWTEAGSFPAGTVMLFYQAAAPTGWTKLTTQNDKALRVVSGNGGVAGGSNPFSTVMAQTVVGNHTMTLGETAAGIASNGSGVINVYAQGTSNNWVPFSSSDAMYPVPVQSLSPGGYNCPYTPNGTISSVNGLTGNASFPVTSTNTSGGVHNHPITMAIQYIDVILASKN